jgi:hypothetical protein
MKGPSGKSTYYPGKFFSANMEKASKENEHNALLLESPAGKPVAFVQIAGLVARRIICAVQPGDAIKRGQRFGMICFGSRLDIYLPQDTEIRVTVGDKVQAGSSIIGKMVALWSICMCNVSDRDLIGADPSMFLNGCGCADCGFCIRLQPDNRVHDRENKPVKPSR